MLVIIGPTCSGKDTIANKLTSNFDYVRILEYTTRQKRATEQTGKDYWFTSDESFKYMYERGELVGVREFNRYQNGENVTVYYGTSKSALKNSAQNILTTNIGAAKLLKAYAKEQHLPLFIVGIEVSPDEQQLRLSARGDEPAEIAKRIATDAVAYSELYEVADLVINNSTSSTDDTCVIDMLAAQIDTSYAEWMKNLQ